LVKYLAHKLLACLVKWAAGSLPWAGFHWGSNNPGICKVPGPVDESVHPADSVFSFALGVYNLGIDGRPLSCVHSACLVNKLPVFAHDLLGIN
jgi:hypothetical protein